MTSVKLWAQHQWKTDTDGQPEMGLQSFNIERLGADTYRSPTDEERAQYAADEAERKAASKAKRKANPTQKLVNPTNEDAERLQTLWNDAGRARHDKAKAESRLHGEFTPSEVRRMTQAAYSQASKGSYSHFATITVMANGFRHDSRSGRTTARTAPIAFKIRKSFGSGSSSLTPDRIVIINDKPQKPLPLDWSVLEATPEPVEAGRLF